MTDSTQWLNDALKGLNPIPRLDSKGIFPGQIRLVGDSNSDFSRMCVVLEVHSESNYCEIMLIHQEEDMATDDDVVISNKVTDHFQTMIVQTDCHSVVFILQLGEYLDELTSTEMESIGCGITGRPLVDQNLYRGMPIAGRLDYRWRFKANEGDVIRILANDCVEALIEGSVQTFVDPGVLSPELLRKLEDPIPVLINVIESLSGNVASDTSVLSELGALDKEQWIRVMTNLIKNSIQAIPSDRDPKIKVEITDSTNSVKILVSDNGLGVLEENKEKIFEPKFTTKTDGMGLGLGIVKNIINSHRGKISYKSKLKKGTKFTISLPK